MNKLLTKIVGLSLGLSMAIGVGVAVGASRKEAVPVHAASEELAFHFKGSSLATGTSYQAWSGSVSSATTSKVSSATWQITVGNNSAQLGTNAKNTNLSKTTLGNGNFSAASGVATALGITTSTQKYSAVYCTTGMSNITKGELIFTGTNGGAITTAWLLSSTDGSTWTIESSKTSSITTGSTFTVTKSSTAKQFAFVCYWNLTNSGGLKGFEYKLYGEYEETQTITVDPASKEAYTDATISLTTNATSASWALSNNTCGATLSAASGKSVTVSATSAGSVRVTATASGYTSPYVDLTFVERPTSPYITPAKSSTSGYTGQDETISVTYGNLTTGLAVSSGNTSVVDASVDTDDGEGNADIYLEFNGVGSTTVSLKDGSIELATISVTVSASSVTITGLDSTGSVAVGGTLDLGSQITVTAVGSYSDSVTWSSATTSVATVSNAGVVTGVGLGISVITVTSVSDPSVSASCTVTVALLHTYTFGTTASTTQLTDINTKYSYSEFSGETTLYGTTGNCIRMSTGSAIGSFVYTLGDSGAYITKVTLSVKAWSSSEKPTLSVTPNGGSAVTHEYTDANNFVDYSFDIPASGEYTSVTIATTAAKRAYLSGMTVQYAYKNPEITSNANNFEIAASASQNIELTFANYATTPTVTYAVTSGASSVSSVTGYDSLTDNVATITITATSTTGSAVIRFTGTAGSQTTYIDITFDVITPKTITDLEITTAGTITFVEDDEFSVGPLVLTATFSDSSTTVYSAANDNLGLLTFDPSIGDVLTTSDTSVTVYVTAYGDDVFQMYDITVSEKPYATQVTSVSSLWDGQQVYFADQSETRVSAPHTGGNNMSSVNGTFVSGKGLSINETTGAQAYTVGRVIIDSVIYYTFSFENNGTKYWLSDTGTSSNNYLGRITLTSEDVTTLNDTAGNCGYWTISITDGVASITSKTNTNTASLRWNSSSSIFACYKTSGSQTDPVLYAVESYSANAVADDFASGAMHMDDYDSQSGYCKDEDHNYYANAKRVWNAMSSDERSAVMSSQTSAYARLDAWARANGDILDSNNVLSTKVMPNILNIDSNGATAIIVIVSLVSLTSIGAFFALRKRKENI